MRLQEVQGIARAQKLAREVILEVAGTVRPGQTEREVAGRIDARLRGLGVSRWLHTAYAWWGERTRFQDFGTWEAGALPSERVLQEGEPFILDVAPLVEGHPADFAYSGLAGLGGDVGLHQALLGELAELKRSLVEWARKAADGAALFSEVDAAVRARGRDPIHPLYPAGVLGHRVEGFPNLFGRIPPMGEGFQWPLLGPYALALVGHHVLGRPYPFINANAAGKLQGVFAVEPHLAQGGVGAKFESMLIIDGDETRWLDPDLFGEVVA